MMGLVVESNRMADDTLDPTEQARRERAREKTRCYRARLKAAGIKRVRSERERERARESAARARGVEHLTTRQRRERARQNVSKARRERVAKLRAAGLIMTPEQAQQRRRERGRANKRRERDRQRAAGVQRTDEQRRDAAERQRRHVATKLGWPKEMLAPAAYASRPPINDWQHEANVAYLATFGVIVPPMPPGRTRHASRHAYRCHFDDLATRECEREIRREERDEARFLASLDDWEPSPFTTHPRLTRKSARVD